jgi:hypothetical protein
MDELEIPRGPRVPKLKSRAAFEGRITEYKRLDKRGWELSRAVADDEESCLLTDPDAPRWPIPRERDRAKFAGLTKDNLRYSASAADEIPKGLRAPRDRNRAKFMGLTADDKEIDKIGKGMMGVAMGDPQIKQTAENDIQENPEYGSVTFYPGGYKRKRSETPEIGRNGTLKSSQIVFLLILSTDPGLRRETAELSEGDMVWERIKNDMEREYSKRRQHQPYSSVKYTVDEQTQTAQITLVASNQFRESHHREFLTGLFATHPSYPGPKRRPRMTALEMWDISDEWRRQADEAAEAEEAEMAQMSATPESANKLGYGNDEHKEISTDMEVDVATDYSPQVSTQDDDAEEFQTHGEDDGNQKEEVLKQRG